MMKPMLAHKYDEKRIDWSEPVYIHPKLDGVSRRPFADLRRQFEFRLYLSQIWSGNLRFAYAFPNFRL